MVVNIKTEYIWHLSIWSRKEDLKLLKIYHRSQRVRAEINLLTKNFRLGQLWSSANWKNFTALRSYSSIPFLVTA